MTNRGHGAPALVALFGESSSATTPTTRFYLMTGKTVDYVRVHNISTVSSSSVASDASDHGGGISVVSVSREDGVTRLAVRVPRSVAACAVSDAAAPFAACLGGPTFMLLAHGTSDNLVAHPEGTPRGRHPPEPRPTPAPWQARRAPEPPASTPRSRDTSRNPLRSATICERLPHASRMPLAAPPPLLASSFAACTRTAP